MGWAVIISRRPAPLPLIIAWALQAQSNPTAPSDLAADYGGSIALEWDVPTQRAASIPGTPQVGETPTANIPKVVDAHALNHAAFTCRWGVAAAANAGIDGNGLDNATYTHQRTAGDSDIDGVTSPSYALTSDEEDDTVQVQVSFTDDDFFETATSVATATVEAGPVANNPAARLTTTSGTPEVEQTLTVDTSGICGEHGLSNVSYSYQWIAGRADINGATGASLALTASQLGHDILVRVAFTDDVGNSESLTSAATATVVAKPTPLTTSFGNVWDSHDGSNEFTFDQSFSENIKAGYERGPR